MTAANGISPQEGDMKEVDLEAFAKMAGFPLNLIKEELLINSDFTKMGDLRESLLGYLNTNFEESAE